MLARFLACLWFASWGLAAAAPTPQFKGLSNVHEAPLSEYRLNDASGATRTLAEFQGKILLVTFGFTHCPDICPSVLGRLAQAVRALGSMSEQIQVVFISLDPERDTPALTDQYVRAFHPAFLALNGNEDRIETIARAFRVYYRKVPGVRVDQYTIDHSAYLYGLDRNGRLRVKIPPDSSVENIEHDLRRLLEIPVTPAKPAKAEDNRRPPKPARLPTN